MTGQSIGRGTDEKSESFTRPSSLDHSEVIVIFSR